MRGGLEATLQVDNEWMLNNRQNLLFTLHVVDLLQFNNRTFLQAFECQRLSFISLLSVLDEPNSTKSTCSESRQDFEIVKEEFPDFPSLASVIDLLLGLIIVN